MYFRELTAGDTKRKQLILKVLLIATSGSKMVRFDSGCRIMDVLRKLVDATGSSIGCDGEMLFCLFRGNEPLDEDATLAELGLNDRVCINSAAHKLARSLTHSLAQCDWLAGCD